MVVAVFPLGLLAGVGASVVAATGWPNYRAVTRDLRRVFGE
ncbi:MAG: hypothetical protein ACR2IR_02550 [Acidimicrobiia bacterium]